MQRAIILFAAALLPCVPLVSAQARATRTAAAPMGPGPAVTLTAGLSPERLGAGTTVHLGFQIASPPGQIPSALTEIDVLYPAELGIGTSSLGLDECSAARLQEYGLAGCPPNSLMGHGSALAEVPFAFGPLLEPVRLTLLAGPVQDGHLGLLFFASGESPVLAELVFPALVLPARAPFGGRLNAKLPLVPGVPDGPDAAILRLETTIGPSHITYYKRVHGRTVGFRPRGILLPTTCPRGGFLFTIGLTFQDGTHGGASATVPCPRRG